MQARICDLELQLSDKVRDYGTLTTRFEELKVVAADLRAGA